jgi:hypothetical protein
MRLIDADKLMNYCNTNHLISASLTIIASQPTVEVTNVIHCKDCKFFDVTGDNDGVCQRNGDMKKGAEYCSSAANRS